jgi:hypothetical protein
MATQHGRLAQRPLAYFILCDTLREYTPANRQIALGYVDPLRKLKEPVSVGLFAGRRDFGTVHPLLRWLMMRLLRLAEGDWRDWQQIRSWATALAPRLVAAGPPPVAVH